MNTMNLEPQEYDWTASTEVQDRLSTDNATEIIGSWCSELEAGYTLYEVLPSVGTLPTIYAIACEERFVDEEGEYQTEEEIVQLGVLNGLQRPDTPESISDVAYDVVSLVGVGDTLTVFEDAIFDSVDIDNFVELQGNRLTFEITTEILEGSVLESKTDWSTVQALFEALADADGYPMHSMDSDYMYEYQARLKLVPIQNHIDWFVKQPFIEAIEDYQNGVFANKPSMALIYALSTENDMSQKEIAEHVGVGPSVVSRQLSNADEWITRAKHTAMKYDNM